MTDEQILEIITSNAEHCTLTLCRAIAAAQKEEDSRICDNDDSDAGDLCAAAIRKGESDE